MQLHDRTLRLARGRQCTRLAIITVALLTCSLAARADQSATPAGWEFAADVHLFAASITGTTARGGDLDIGFSDLLENLNFAAMGSLRAGKGDVMLFTDFIYLKVKADDGARFTVPVGRLHRFNVPVDVDATVTLKSWIVTTAAGYRVIDNEQGNLYMLAGARYLWIDVNATLDAKTRRLSRAVHESASGGNWDGIVGVTGEINLDDSRKWYLQYYGDVGTGQSDRTWAAQGSIGYRFDTFDVHAGYRYMDWNLQSGAALSDLNVSGVIVGARFRF